MSLDLHIVGPGLDVHRRLHPGEPSLVLGRDADCTICLPDPQRRVSRRHLSIWNEGDQLLFHVLSVVNGVETTAGELGPGERGALEPGESLLLGEYRLEVAAPAPPPAPAPGAPDPWAEFEKEAAHLLASVAVPPPAEDDPFGDWGFQSTFGPGTTYGPERGEAPPAAADLGAFFQGLGLAGAMPGSFAPGELEAMGRLTRRALQGLLQGLQAVTAAAADPAPAAGAADHTVQLTPRVNPLRMDTPLESKLWYLFGGLDAAAGCIPPEQAVAEVADELLARHQALAESARAAVRSVLLEFDPEALKQRLLPGGAKLFTSARAWEAYARDYALRRQDLEGWVAELLERHFARVRADALERVKPHAEPGPPG